VAFTITMRISNGSIQQFKMILLTKIQKTHFTEDFNSHRPVQICWLIAIRFERAGATC